MSGAEYGNGNTDNSLEVSNAKVSTTWVKKEMQCLL